MKIKHQFLFVISLVLLVAFVWSVINRLLFLNRAEHSVAVVRELQAHNSRCGGKRRRDCTKYLATVEFQSAGSTQSGTLDAGDTRGHDQPLSKARHQIGEPVPIVFDPSRPEEIHHDDLWDIWGSSLAWLGFQVFALVASLRRGESDEPATLNLNESQDEFKGTHPGPTP